MKRIGILTAGGDTPALNATIFGAVERANDLGIEVLGIIRGFSGIIDPRLPHVRLNPLFTTIPELDPCHGGTLIGASRTSGRRLAVVMNFLFFIFFRVPITAVAVLAIH